VGVLFAAPLAGIYQLGIFRHMAQEFPAGQVVVNQDLGLLQQLLAADRDETRVAWACPDQVD
jgi:hypothetical protein